MEATLFMERSNSTLNKTSNNFKLDVILGSSMAMSCKIMIF